MNIKRIVTAVIGFPIVMTILILGNKYVIDAIVAIIGIFAMYEYIKCVNNSKSKKVIPWISYLSVISIAFIHIIPTEFFKYITILGLPVLILILFMHVIVTNAKITYEDIVYTFFGIAYILFFLTYLALVYGIEDKISGKILIWYLIFSAWGTDVFAYLIGKNFGKTKFSKISPNKSIEGCLAGIFGAIVSCTIFSYCLNNIINLNISYITTIIISLILSIIGQIGDFSASVIKRYFNVKDFSNLFPGHGGMLDRIDSVMFISPFAYFLFSILL